MNSELDILYQSCINQKNDGRFFLILSRYCKTLFEQEGIKEKFKTSEDAGKKKIFEYLLPDIVTLNRILETCGSNFRLGWTLESVCGELPYIRNLRIQLSDFNDSLDFLTSDILSRQMDFLEMKLTQLDKQIEAEPWYCASLLDLFYYTFFELHDTYARAVKSDDTSMIDTAKYYKENMEKALQSDNLAVQDPSNIFNRDKYQQLLGITHAYILSGQLFQNSKILVKYDFEDGVLTIGSNKYKFKKGDIITYVLEYLLKHKSEKMPFHRIESAVENQRGDQLNDRSIDTAVRRIIDKIKCDLVSQSINSIVIVNNDKYDIQL
jgi:hypothetical protein